MSSEPVEEKVKTGIMNYSGGVQNPLQFRAFIESLLQPYGFFIHGLTQETGVINPKINIKNKQDSNLGWFNLAKLPSQCGTLVSFETLMFMIILGTRELPKNLWRLNLL